MKAVLVSVDWDAEDLMWSFFDGADSVKRAEQLLESIKGDYPNCTHRIIADEEAWKAQIDRKLAVWLGSDDAAGEVEAVLAVTGWDRPCQPDVDYHTYSNPIPPSGALCQCGRTYYRIDGYAVTISPNRMDVIQMTDKQFDKLVEQRDRDHVEVITKLTEIDAKLDTKADAVDRDLYATTLGLDRGKSGKA